MKKKNIPRKTPYNPTRTATKRYTIKYETPFNSRIYFSQQKFSTVTGNNIIPTHDCQYI